jgi:hypothetical protein
MKICWDNLEKFHLTHNGFLRKGRHSYIEMDACKECGHPYLMLKFQKTEFCSSSCAQKHRKISIITRKKLSKALLGYKRTKKECEAISKRMSKGGVVKKNLPLHNTYAHQLEGIEEVRHCPKDVKLLEVKCAYCNEWFVPKRTRCEQRCQFIKGNVDRENLFYCSEECKALCPVFHKKRYSAGHNPRKHRNNQQFTENELRIWREEVLKRANYKCEYCGKEAIIAHHSRPKKLEPFFALDPHYGIACCEGCHYKYGHRDSECTTGYLANTVCV